MKKKLLLIPLMVSLLMCAFVLCVSAEDNIIKLSELPTLEEIHANRGAYVSRVDALEVFEEGKTNYKELDPDSVVVLSDLAETPTYYVYPCYYFIRSSYYSISGNVSNFNSAIQAADSTAFASYSSEGSGNKWAKGECDYVIRIEFPKYVTQIHGEYKFEGSANVKEIYFPVYTTVDEETGLEKTVPYCATISGQNLFGDCPKLEVMHNHEYLPASLVQGNNGGFSRCTSLKEFIIPEGVTHIPASCFYMCSSLTEIRMPNTVKSVGKMAFASCTGLKSFSFGSGFSTFYSPNNDFETFLSSPNVKYFYLPNNDFTFKYDNGNVSTKYYNIFNSGTKVTYFYTGTKEEAEAMQAEFASSGANATIASATIVEYDPTVNYDGYADMLGYSIIVYGYNTCKAFYGDNHVNSTSYDFAGGTYVSEYCRFDGCERCGDIKTTSYGKLLVNKGYSIAESGEGFTYDIKFNKEVIAIYEENEGTTFSYGIVAGKITEGDGGKIVTEAGEKATDGVFTSNFTETSYELFNVKVTGVNTAEYKAKDVYLSAFIIDGEDVYYLGQGVTSEAVAISYDKIFALNTPSSDEE